MYCRIQDGGFSFRRSVSIYLWWIKMWTKLSQKGNKCKGHCGPSLKEGNQQMIKKLTQHLKHLLWPKKYTSSWRHGRINTNSWGLMERKTKCSESFLGNTKFVNRKNTKYSHRTWGSERIICKQTAWKHMRTEKSYCKTLALVAMYSVKKNKYSGCVYLIAVSFITLFENDKSDQ